MKNHTRKKKILAIALCALLTFSFAACKGTENPNDGDKIQETQFWSEGVEEENEKFTDFTREIFQKAYSSSMLDLHFTLKDPVAYGIERPKMDLYASDAIDAQEILNLLNGFSFKSLSRKNQITYEIIKEDLTDALSWAELPPLSSSFSYSSGVQTNLVTILNEYKFYDEQDLYDYLDMLEQLPEYLFYLFSLESERVEQGYGFADFILDDVIEQMNALVEEGENSSMITTFVDRIDDLSFISKERKEGYKEEIHWRVTEKILPAFGDLATAMSTFYGRGTNEVGLCGYEGGKDYYEMIVKTKGGWCESVDDLMKSLLSLYDTTLDSFRDLVKKPIAYTQYEKWYNGASSAPTDPVTVLDYYKEKIEKAFPVIDQTQYTIRYLSEAEGQNMSSTLAYYLNPPIDDYLTGDIAINTYAENDGMMQTLCHEGYPGHLYQNVYYLSSSPDPVRSLFSFVAYDEGWAVYAANRADHLYSYPISEKYYPDFNELETTLDYALCAIVDVGVNYYGWTTKDIFTYFGNEYPSLYQFVIEAPGTYLSYGVGNLLMIDLRHRAEELAGKTFNEVEYHRFVLDVGPCNFSLLQKLLKEYYQFKK